MTSYDIHESEFQPKRITMTRHFRKALKQACIDAIAGATAVTLLVFISTL